MSDHETHGSGITSLWSGLSNKQKLVVGGAAAAVGIGVVVAVRNGKSNLTTQEALRSYDTTEDEKLTPWTDGKADGTAPPTYTPAPETDLTDILDQISGLKDQINSIPAVPYDQASYVATYGNGGADYNSLDAAGKKAMTDNYNSLFTDSAKLAADQVRTAEVIENRKAAGLDISEQLAWQQKLNGIASGAITAPSSGKTSSVQGTSGQTSTSSSKPTSQTSASSSSSSSTSSAAAAAANEKLYLTNMANGKTSDGSAANAGQIAWAKAQLAKK